MKLALPGSKSLTNRALILAALCDSPSKLTNLLVSDDTEACIKALRSVKSSKKIDCRDAGTVARFLLPVCAALGGQYYFDGSLRMRERPIGVLLDILEGQGVVFEFLGEARRMPFIMISQGLRGGNLVVDVTDSSQFLSGLLMAAPLTKQGITIRSSEAISMKPYVKMTLQLMEKFGVMHQLLDDFIIQVPHQSYQAAAFAIEVDASTASYFLAAAALLKASVKVDFNPDSLQGDWKFLDVLEQMGCCIKKEHGQLEVTGPQQLKGIGEINMRNFSDTMMTLAIIAPFLPTPTTIRGIGHTRLQESDRIAAMVAGLTHAGIHTHDTEGSLTIFPGIPHAARINSYQDHRIAMSFGVMGLAVPGVVIDGAECVSKTCPEFFELLKMCRPI